jgi:hypothetical protein
MFNDVNCDEIGIKKIRHEFRKLRHTQSIAQADLAAFIQQNIKDVSLLVTLATADRAIKKICCSQYLNDYWLAQISALNIAQQPEITPFELVSGLYFYLKAREIVTKNGNALCSESENLLRMAIKYKSFHALKMFIEYAMLPNLAKVAHPEELKTRICNTAKKAILHKTPGHILLTKICCHVGQHCEIHHTNNTAYQYFCQKALHHFRRANTLRPISQAAIANAKLFINDRNFLDPFDFYTLLDTDNENLLKKLITTDIYEPNMLHQQ